ncbi:hypothetical protein CSV75_02980 [Sporosarcina sp. P18a]|uniref:hypothetical protein n=1 Tax=Sporosarcina sp. P18a TaxID=2048259 RepID=UPI000C16DB1B|nr:hypothetical protein [Sporosarcina sp. P18a]PIC80767.1 hypothetical protein CSV75_02980 [Sporosarcina sp. P18a]
MQTVSLEVQELTIRSLESTHNKLSNAYKSMTEKGSNTTLVEKRRDAIKVGLDSLQDVWYDVDFFYDRKVTLQSKEILQSIIPSIEKQLAKAKDGSPQKTVNERRVTALKLAIESLADRLK